MRVTVASEVHLNVRETKKILVPLIGHDCKSGRCKQTLWGWICYSGCLNRSEADVLAAV